MEKLGSKIKSRREELGMSQTELAKLTGYSDKSAISRIESGNNDIPARKLRLFAYALKLSETSLASSDDKLADLGNLLSPDEFALIVAYRNADTETKRDILRRLDIR